jgi:hypothetical protein
MGGGEIKQRVWQTTHRERLQQEEIEHRLVAAWAIGSTIISVAAGAAAIGGVFGVKGALGGAIFGGIAVGLSSLVRLWRQPDSHDLTRR